ncbi:MAG: alpha/beta fold hydrolase [Deltaproteobacteria bacterium]|nr:alpha/beta fold hydrolase [Deltaproteobacteria bacterium]
MRRGFDGVDIYDRVLTAMHQAGGGVARRVRLEEGSAHLLELPGAGELPPMLLLHGFSASGVSQYGPLVRRLRPHVRRFFLPDLPGHGQSTTPRDGLRPEAMADAVLAVLDALPDEPTVVFASSMAGGLAVQASLRRPEKVRALVLCSPSGAPFAPDELDRFFRIFSVRSHRDALEFVDRLLPASREPRPPLRAAGVDQALRHAYAWGVRQQFNRDHLVALLRRVPSMRFLTPDELGALAMPTYLIWGRSDDILPPSHVAYYRAHLPGHARIETPEHFGHTPFLHHPDELSARLLAFLRGLPPRGVA